VTQNPCINSFAELISTVNIRHTRLLLDANLSVPLFLYDAKGPAKVLPSRSDALFQTHRVLPGQESV